MIKIVAKMIVREDAVEKFHALARELVEKSRGWQYLLFAESEYGGQKSSRVY